MPIDIGEKLEENIKKVVNEYNYPDEINKYLLSLVQQLRTSGKIPREDLIDLLDRIGKAVGED